MATNRAIQSMKEHPFVRLPLLTVGVDTPYESFHSDKHI